MTDDRTAFFLHPDIEILFSNRNDGSMASAGGKAPQRVHELNAAKFYSRHRVGKDRALLQVVYVDSSTYCDVQRVASNGGLQDVVADAAYTTDTNFAITLPVADCVATIVYDPTVRMIGVLHLGRHSSVAGLIEAFAIEVADRLGGDPRDWHVWMSPSLRKANDKLQFFHDKHSREWKDYVQDVSDGVYIDTVGHNCSRFERAGVRKENITVEAIDTFEDDQYFSHRAATTDNRPQKQGKMMVVVRMKPTK